MNKVITFNDFTKGQQKAIQFAFHKILMTNEEDIYKVIYPYKRLQDLNSEYIEFIYDYIQKGQWN